MLPSAAPAPDLAPDPDPTAAARAEFEEFVYLLSHDVRASVRAMSELPEWIREDLVESGIALPDSVAEYFALMRTQTTRLDRMLLDLLAYSRVGRMQAVCDIDFTPALDAALAEVDGNAGFEITRAVRINTLRIGERDLVMLLTCLLSNAVKHNPAGTGAIHVAAQCADRDVMIEVTDDGPGIPEKDHARVMGPMTTLRSRDEVEGSGMGLAVAAKIAKHYGGNVVLGAGIDGRGLCVRVLLKQPLQS